MKTPLPPEVYEALAAAVGAANISDDDSTVASHAWNALGGDPGANKLSAFWPSAIVLPGSTEEVQAVVKICNRHDVRFRAVSTGVFSTNGKAGHYIILDLRRMNGLKIDARNQIAEIGPYATAGQIQAEAMKHGLTCHIVGAGPPHSPLASAAAMQGIGISGATTGANYRNLLSFEWVTPEGEVLRVGSAGCGAGWFSGEGPGPGFRGMIRGDTGTMGGLGVFTKIGLKLHPWRAPTRSVESVGQFPQLGMKIPENGKLYHIVWDSWEDTAAAALKFNAARVADFWVRIPPHNLAGMLTPTNNDYVERATAGTLPEAARNESAMAWTVLTVSLSEAEARYKARVMQAIIAETHGRQIQLAPEHAEVMARNLVTSAYIIRAFRPALAGLSSFGIMDSFKLLPKVMAAAEEMTAPDIARGHFASSGPEGVWSWPNEGRYIWAENVPTYDTADKSAAAAAIRYYLRLAERMLRNPIGVNGFLAGPGSDIVGPRLDRVDTWMRRVKAKFDPKSLSMAQYYVEREPGPQGKAWPIGGRFLLSRWGAPLFKLITEAIVTKSRN